MKYRLLLPILFFACQASAWGPEGHQISALIAQPHLTPKTAQACRAILGGKDLADVANWPDDVRSDPTYKFLEPFHFARVPLGDTYETAPPNPNGDVIEAVDGLYRFFKSGDINAMAKVAPLKQLTQEQQLAMLIHTVPDANQPLHISNPEDFGGNKVVVTWTDPKTGEDKTTRLHGLIDGVIIMAQGLTAEQYSAKLLKALTKAQFEASQSEDFVAMADEGIALRVQIYTYPDPQPGPLVDGQPSVAISTKYVNVNLPMIEDRLIRGGLRLAYLLNKAFDPEFEKQK